MAPQLDRKPLRALGGPGWPRAAPGAAFPGQRPGGPEGSGLWARVMDTAGGEGPTLPSAPASALAAESHPSPLCWPPTLSSFSHSAPSPGPGHGTAEHKETHPFTKRSFWNFRQSHIERAPGTTPPAPWPAHRLSEINTSDCSLAGVAPWLSADL